jgi:DnaD/phage-associated family protein
MGKGAFIISRNIFENPIWQDIPKFRIFFYILGNAVFAEEGVRKGDIHIKRGQFLASYRKLSNELEYIENNAVRKYSVSMIKRKIDELVKEHRLEIEQTKLGTLFTVVNYDLYQVLENYRENNLEQAWNKVGTDFEQAWNKVGTDFEQTWNNNKNVNNVEQCNINNNIESKNENDIKSNSFEFFENNVGILTPFVMEQIQAWEDELSSEIVIRAMKEAVHKNVRNWSYINTILKNWADKGVKTLKDVEHVMNEFRKKKITNSKKTYSRKSNYNSKAIRKEPVPEWLNNGDKPYIVETEDNWTQEKFEREKEQLEKWLKQKYGNKEKNQTVAY